MNQYLPYFFPAGVCEGWGKREIIPFIYGRLDLSQFKNIPKGKYDDDLKQAAEGAVQYGEKYGGFFITTMWEMNLKEQHCYGRWCEQPSSFKKTWKYIWELFEKKGANKYATWVIEYHVDELLPGYWPGDEYIDWIGLSGYNRKPWEHVYGYRYLNQLIGKPYSYLRSANLNKPLMLSECGTTIGEDQPKWLIDAFKTIKSMPGLKAVDFFDNRYTDKSGWVDHHTLSLESLKTLKEILKDPYFIMAR
jgi:hypothetical protein